MDRKVHNKMTIFPKFICGFNIILIKITKEFLGSSPYPKISSIGLKTNVKGK
jgi:hypothetical protein